MANYTIANGANIPTNVQTGTIPNMGDALRDWFQLLVFGKITKSTVAYQELETVTDINFWGIVQPLKPRELILKPEGQRAWSWFDVWTQAAPVGALIELQVDDVGYFLGKQTRVMSRKDYALYSITNYQWVQDWFPDVPTP